MIYDQMTKQQKETILAAEQARFEEFKAMNLNLDMSRGKPCREQLDLSMGLYDTLSSKTEIKGIDYRNYGILDGIPEFKKIYEELLNLKSSEIAVLGNSSLNLMYDSIQRAMQFGVLGGVPLNKQQNNKWLCPVPGYDRHFAVTGVFGFDMVNVPMTQEGPDMDTIEELVKDETVKGIWCVPKYSNPQGIIYSETVVKRLAALKPASKDFRIYWDNAYMVHTLAEHDEPLTDILAEAKKCGNEDIVLMFGSTSKVTFAGAGIAFVAGSEKNLADVKAKMGYQTIGPDKMNQYAHALFLKDAAGVYAQMQKHRAVIKPKFDMVLKVLDEELSGTGIAEWLNPTGGYFISCDLKAGTAKKTIALCKSLGVIFTPAGSTYPRMSDPNDSNVRIAPTLPPIKDLEMAMRVFCCCAKLTALNGEV